jgi:4-hydroxy-3-methylbut-2-enyl diphosphate reductase IspH
MCTRMGDGCVAETDGADIAAHWYPGAPGTQDADRCNLRDGRPMEVYLAQSRGFCAGIVGAMGTLKNKAATTVSEGITGALQARFTDIQGPDIRDICYATQNRQSAVRNWSKLVDVILVVGAANSSNRLREIGTEAGVASYMIADGSALDPEWLKDARTVGATAGASASGVLVDDVIEAMRRIGPVQVSALPGREENIEFRLPAQLAAS